MITSEQNRRNHNLTAQEGVRNMSLVSPDKAELAVENHNEGSIVDTKRKTNSNSCDAMDIARAALASAERASAAARRAAELLNAKSDLFPLSREKS